MIHTGYIISLGLCHHHQEYTFWQVFWLACLHEGLPIAVVATVALRVVKVPLKAARARSQRWVRTGFTPVSLFVQSGNQKVMPLAYGKNISLSRAGRAHKRAIA